MQAEAIKARARQTIAELTRLARSNVDDAQFFGRFLPAFMELSRADCGAVWLKGPDGSQLAFESGFQETLPADERAALAEHAQAVASVCQTAQPAMFSPLLRKNGEVTFALLPLGDARATYGAAEIGFPGPPGGMDIDHLRSLGQVCDIAREFLDRKASRAAASTAQLSVALDRFTSTIHGSLDSKWVAYSIANEARLLTECDRVSVAVRKGDRFPVMATSGVEAVDRRSNLVQALEQLVARVLAAREPLWFTGDDEGLPPQIAQALQRYLDHSRASRLAVIPLTAGTGAEGVDPESLDRPTPPQLVGALITENFSARPAPGLEERTVVVARHASLALANALAVDDVLLLSTWRWLGRIRREIFGRWRNKALAIGAAVLACAIALAVIPADLEMLARGTLEPVERADVFAEVDGVVVDVRAEHGKVVSQGDLLVVLRNDPLELELTAAAAKRRETEQTIEGVQNSLLANRQLPADQQNRLQAELRTHEKALEGVKLQEASLAAQAAALRVASPMPGSVVTWDAARLLRARPVQRGQVLLRVADLEGAWRLEVQMPEHKMGHVARTIIAGQQAGRTVPVSFSLATDPGREYQGYLDGAADRAELDDKQAHTVELRVAIDDREIPPELLRPGAAVSVKVNCGRASIGYVWLHEVWEWVQREALFRL